MNWRRLILCEALEWHKGDVEVARVENEKFDLAVTFIPCSRCGKLHPLEVQPYGELRFELLGGPLRDHR